MYTIIDIEATTGDAKKGDIIEIALFKYDGNKIVDQFISLVSTQKPIEPFVQKLTGISPKMIHRAPKFHELAKRIVEITEGTVIVGHNVSFDYKILKRHFKDLGFDFERNTIDTLPLAKRLFPSTEAYGLSKLCRRLGIPMSDVHRASGDARATVELFKLLLQKDAEKTIIKSFVSLGENQAKQHYSRLAKALPKTAGVFYCFDKNKRLIYYSPAMNMGLEAAKLSGASYFQKWLPEVSEIKAIETENIIIAALKFQLEHKSQKGLVRRKSKWLTSGFSYRIYKAKKGRSHSLFLDFESKKAPFICFSDRKKAEQFIIEYNRSTDRKKEFSQVLTRKKVILTFENKNVKENRFFVVMNHQKIVGFGSYKVFSQLNDLGKIESLLVKTQNNSYIMSLLRSFIYSNRFEHMMDYPLEVKD